MSADRRRLDSWKAIAGHLNRNVRTVIRWEQDRALPVHRVPGGGSGSVFAYTDELDAWLAGRLDETATTTADSTPSARSRFVALPVLIALISILAVAAVRWATPLQIGSIAVEGEALVASTPNGERLWRYVSERSKLDLRRGRIWSVITDFDARPGDDVVVAGTSAFEEPEALLLLNNRGAVQWLRSFEESFTFGAKRFGPPWRTADLIAFGAEPRIAWAMHHHTWFPSVIATYDAEGYVRDRFIHPGWITSLRASPDGRYLLGAGVRNDLDARVLLVIDGAITRGTVKPAEANSQCSDCPAGDPVRYFVFPRTELSRLDGLPLLNNRAVPKIVVLPSGRILVHVTEHPKDEPVVEAVYEIGPDLSIIGGRPGDSYWDWHRRLEAAGRIDHSAASCPERQGLPMRES